MKVDYYLKCQKCGISYITFNAKIETVEDFVNTECACTKCGNNVKNTIAVLDIIWSRAQ